MSRITKHIYIEILGEEKAKDIIEIINKVRKESDEEMIIEVLKKDREQQWRKGRREGEKMGIAKAIKQMVKEMLKRQMSDDEIMEITKINKEELERLKIA